MVLMPNAAMAHVLKLRHAEIVDGTLVRHDGLNVFRDVLLHHIVDGARFAVFGVNQTQRSTTLTNADDHVFALEFSLLSALASAEVHLVYLDHAFELWAF